MRDHLSASVFILGGGATGLFMAVELAQAGLSVILAERRSKLAGGPSTTNEGMLHRGTYHSAAIRNREEAMEVARRCAHGYERLLAIAPEAIEDTFERSFVLLTDAAKVPDICSRWDEAEVPYSPISLNKYRGIESDIDLSGVKAVFEVEDKSINPRAIYRNLVRRAERLGVRIFTNAEVEQVRPEENLICLRIDGTRRVHISVRVCVCTAGSGIKEFFATALRTEVPMRFWKSHLLDIPRVCRHNLVFLQPGGITLMHHGAWSIVGLNADALPVDGLSTEPVTETVDLLKRNVEELFPHFDGATGIGRACIKVDVGRAINVASKPTSQMKLSFAYGEPLAGHLWVIPGKMTEIPCVAEALIELLRERLKGTIQPRLVADPLEPSAAMAIASRPIDDYRPMWYKKAAGS